MANLPFDLTDPPEPPPPDVRHPLLWRLAICLFRDHSPAAQDPGTLVRCRGCGRVWPCQCRRLAERGLICAYEGDAYEPACRPVDPTPVDAESCDEGPAGGAIDGGAR